MNCKEYGVCFEKFIYICRLDLFLQSLVCLFMLNNLYIKFYLFMSGFVYFIYYVYSIIILMVFISLNYVILLGLI